MWGEAGQDTFAFIKGDSPATTTIANIDKVMDWANNEYLKFGVAPGSGLNYLEGDAVGDIAAFLSDAAFYLDSQIKYYVAVVGGADTYVAVNYGSGEADVVVQLDNVTNLGNISSANIIL